ncbi:STAS domain-containing protein [uncultured Paraglaciecola sp.]|uniref:STAS domain-containing protein n=1 Tax=uncultured Paraglaciecola sp. TaxID=1765024 RepID=UPI0025DD7793|nr:STAS domain-containing protein [uncultured Paraglaciecola sp.]
MSLDRKFSADGKELTIHLGQKFDFEKVRDFRLAYSEGIEEVNSIIINLQKTEYMDSSALGMLLNMQKSLSSTVTTFKISHCQSQVIKILKIARFDKKFVIE